MPQVDLSKSTKMSPEVRKKLEEAFSLDCTVEEASFYAGISKQTYYNWINSDEELKQRFDDLRNKPILKARQVVIDKMTESYSNAMDYLSRKKSDEFSSKSERKVEHSGTVSLGALYDETKE